MSVRIASRADITLEAVRRVAWEGEGVDLAPEALHRMDETHASFMALVAARLAEDPGRSSTGRRPRRATARRSR